MKGNSGRGVRDGPSRECMETGNKGEIEPARVPQSGSRRSGRSCFGGSSPPGVRRRLRSSRGPSSPSFREPILFLPLRNSTRSRPRSGARPTGVTMATDFLNWPDLQPKIAAAVQAGGVDIVELWPIWNYLYRNNLVDLTDMAEEVGRRGGGYEPFVLNSGKVGGRYLGIPSGQSNTAVNYRISWFKEAGVADAEDGRKMDMTWDEYFAVGKKLKEQRKPFGQALGHSTGDPPAICYPYMWCHGAMEVDKDGKTVLFNKPEFVDAMRRFIQAWKDGYDETGTSWDDSNNNRAFLSGQISSTFNGSSIYAVAKKNQSGYRQGYEPYALSQGTGGPVLPTG